MERGPHSSWSSNPLLSSASSNQYQYRGLPNSGGGGRRSRRRRRTILIVLAVCLGFSLLLSALLQLWAPNKKQSHAHEEAAKKAVIQAEPSPAFCQRRLPPLVCAHGGDSSVHPTNTRAAFSAAIELGVDCVEVDTARTADGELIVMHVRELQQLLGRRYRQGQQVGDFEWTYLRTLRWPTGHERIMTVREAIQLTRPYVTSIILDVKLYQLGGVPQDEQLIVEQLLQLVHELSCINCLIWAKNDEVVQSIKLLSPGQRAGLILMNATEDARRAGMHNPLRMREFDVEVIGAHHSMVDDKLLNLLHSHRRLLYVWTINDAAVLQHMLDVGVDALVTNQPSLARDAISWRLAHCTPSTLYHEGLL